MATYTYRITGISIGSFSSSYFLTSCSVAIIPQNGGYKIDLYGTFPINEPMVFFIGSTGSTADYECWSGIVNQGHIIYAITNIKARVWSPRLPIGGPYHIFGYIPSVKVGMLLPFAISTIPKEFTSCTFEIRSLLPSIFQTGPKRIELAPPIL